MIWGTIFIVVGLALLLKNLGIIQAPAWDVVWPVLIIIFGASLLKRKSGYHAPWCQCGQHNQNNQSA